MSHGPQFPGSEVGDEPPKDPGPASNEDLCASCLSAATCAVAVAKGFITTNAGGQSEAIQVARCAFFIPPIGESAGDGPAAR
jgi:hypothetical protein